MSEATQILLAEYRAHTGHFGGPLQDLLERNEAEIHDRRMPDKSCLACTLITIIEAEETK